MANFSPSPGGEGRGEGGRFGTPHFHEPTNPRRGVRNPERGGGGANSRRDAVECDMNERRGDAGIGGKSC